MVSAKLRMASVKQYLPTLSTYSVFGYSQMFVASATIQDGNLFGSMLFSNFRARHSEQTIYSRVLYCHVVLVLLPLN